jgi:hypothetical protein
VKVIIDIPDSVLPDDQQWGILAAKCIRKVAEHVEYCHPRGELIPVEDSDTYRAWLDSGHRVHYHLEPNPFG